MPTRNVNLTEHLDRFVESRVASGRYGNASEVVREALRLLQEREREQKTRLQLLRQAVKEGLDQLDRGESVEFRSREELRLHLAELGKIATAEIADELSGG